MLKVAAGGASGSLNYQGTWDASTNTPTLASGIGTKGYYYLVNVAGNTNLDGITDWQVNDWAVFNGSVWQKVDNSEAVVSVNGLTGAVVLGPTNVGATPNTAFVIASGLLSGGGQLTGNVTVSLDNVPVANVPGAVPNTVYVIAGNNLDGGGPLTGNVTIDLNSLPAANVTGLGTMAFQNANNVTITGGTATGLTNVETDRIVFDITAGVTPTNGQMAWANDDRLKTVAVGINGDNFYLFEDQIFRVRASSNITKGQVIMFSGTLGASGGLEGAPATGLQPDQSNYILGVSKDTFTTGNWGNVQYFGEVKGIDTTGGAENWVQGDVLYYNPAVTGGLTKNKPNTHNAIAVVAAVVYVSSNNGILFVRPTFGSVLGGTDGNVEFGTLANNDFVVYNGSSQRWENYTNTNARTALGLGTIATQNANNVVITGGTIDNVTITNGSATFTGLVTVDNVKTNTLSGYLYGNNGTGNVTASVTIPVADVTGAVPNTRAINTSTGLTGGGDLTADRTLSVVANSTQQLVGVQNNGVDVATRQIINFLPGAGITLAGADDTTRSNVTISVTTPLPSPGTSGNVLTSTGTAWVSNALPATGISLTDDTTSNSTRYITMTANTSGQITTENVSSTKLYFNPSTGQLSSSLFSAENGIVINKNSVSSNVTIGSGYNAMSAGTVTVANNVTVTVTSGRWVIV